MTWLIVWLRGFKTQFPKLIIKRHSRNEKKEIVISKNTKDIMISTNVKFPEESGSFLNILENLVFSK